MRIINRTLCLLLLLGSFAQAGERPNVIVMLADDLGWNDVGYHGGDIDTPSLDRLAAEGVQLDRFYTTPICSPTRAALMTGRNPMRLGVAYGVIMPWDTRGIHPDEHFMPQSFLAAGYQTAMVGKWHLGHSQESYHPNQRGFEHFFGHLHTEVGFFPPFANQGGKDFQVNGESVPDSQIQPDDYETFLLGDEVSRYIQDRDKNKPFFIYMPFIAPHTPLDAPQALQDKYKDINTDLAPARSEDTDRTRRIAKMMFQPSARPMYAAVVDGMDQAIGQVLDTLDAEGLADNTIVLFFSDNGGAAYSVGGADNVPLRGGKGDAFEGGIRVVSVMRWPQGIKPGTMMKDMMTAMDVFPTLAEAAGVPMQNKKKLDGFSFWPAIAGGKAPERDGTVFFASETPIYGHFNIALFKDRWKLVQVVDQDQLTTTVTNYLFDIKEDPYEYNNLASKYPDIVAELSVDVRDWRALYPVNGSRSYLVPPPGWRAPLDWASYMQPLRSLQAEPAPGMPPAFALPILDMQHGERGRLIYDCEQKWWSFGLCLRN